MKQKQPAVYIITNKRNGTLYTGVTGDLPGRIWQHKNGIVAGFTRKYRLHLLVYFEMHGDFPAAIAREKQLKGWMRKWKLDLIEKDNPDWRDLYEEIH